MTVTSANHANKLVYFEPTVNTLPQALEYPHFYTPINLAQQAAEHLQEKLKNQLPFLTKEAKGRMLGVLVVKDEDGKLGYIAAYSGELQPALERLPFVPPVHQLPKGEDFPEMASINAISAALKTLLDSAEYANAQEQLQKVTAEVALAIKTAKLAAKQAKKDRDKKRKAAALLPDSEQSVLLEELNRQGAIAGMDLRRFTRSQNQRLEKAKQEAQYFDKKVKQLKALRKAKSAALQDAIFAEFVFTNALGETKDVKSVFLDVGVEVPPAGAGECAAPKLFQYAFKNNLKPLALAEFWWGASPNSEIRVHGNYYPACKGKCKPILAHMLKGTPVKPNPLLTNFGADKTLEILFEDENLVVVNKPSGMLSVPGKHIKDSVKSRIQDRYPKATGPLIVHRLDQDTSGVMVVALTKEAHKALQLQFLERTIRKTYMALLEKAILATEGKIELPLILDINNRPMQKVSYEHGKPALTYFKVVQKTSSKTLIKLHPITGRSHQLRVHCAHKLGLQAPILGDNLYGTPASRLCLHAQEITFKHPTTQKEMVISTEVPFAINP
ncbi:RluA family pseudouridine synthase [Croceivirga sp. JEA036]|uniref:RluA family pseudouridine synthase n=1 Tax=Croceivirga sp. JEA036 TaxID=2721162 RepID=UPI001438B050|nr:RluA family pseudouridine synthase [Croceivirga sp. JEA036]NJB37780.1 RluA family pseudouridine synthase [Croceivirga sp. JEA036]